MEALVPLILYILYYLFNTVRESQKKQQNQKVMSSAITPLPTKKPTAIGPKTPTPVIRKSEQRIAPKPVKTGQTQPIKQIEKQRAIIPTVNSEAQMPGVKKQIVPPPLRPAMPLKQFFNLAEIRQAVILNELLQPCLANRNRPVRYRSSPHSIRPQTAAETNG